MREPVHFFTARRWAADFIADIRRDDENGFRYESRTKQLEAAADMAYDYYYYCPNPGHGAAALAARQVLLGLIKKYRRAL